MFAGVCHELKKLSFLIKKVNKIFENEKFQSEKSSQNFQILYFISDLVTFKIRSEITLFC